jgi:hypothetical protein
MAAEMKLPATPAALLAQLSRLRKEGIVWTAGTGTVSLTAVGNVALRDLRLHSARDRQRLFRLRNLARGH